MMMDTAIYWDREDKEVQNWRENPESLLEVNIKVGISRSPLAREVWDRVEDQM